MTDRPIADYAIIGDTRTTALIARDGSIDWLCWPRHDSPAVFLRLLDATRGGFCGLEFDDLVDTTRRYLPGTNILETLFVTASGRARLVDSMPLHPLEDVPEEGPDGEATGQIHRLLFCDAGHVAGRLIVRPTFDYARSSAEPTPEPDGSVTFRGAGETIRVAASLPLSIQGGHATGRFALREGRTLALVLAHGETAKPDPAAAFESLAATTAYWEAWSARCTYDGPYRDTVIRSVLVLKLLTHAPSGAIIAAATTSLPEAVPGNRNFDYRFTWMRDASFTVTAFVNLGYVREAAEFLRFLRDADKSHGRHLRLMYAIDGDVPEETTLDHLSGWRGIGPVRIGNGAAEQSQHDIYGEFLVALNAFLEAVDYDPPIKVNDRLRDVLGHLTDHIMRCRDEPDHGIWELRGAKRNIVHSKAMLWVGLGCAARIARATKMADPDRIELWEAKAAEIRAEYQDRAWSESLGSYRMAYDGEELDAAVLRTVLFGAFEPTSPRVAATLDVIGAQLGAGDLIYRYRYDDGLDGEEATFTACAFWRVGCLALAGRLDEATPLFERLLGRANDVGLFAEEIDAATGEQRGNVPQGFTHMAVINHAIRLARSKHRPA